MDDSDSERDDGARGKWWVATWRKVLGCVFAFIVVGPLLYAMFASYFEKISFASAFGQVYYLWYGVYVLIPIALVAGLYDLWRRYVR